MRHGSVFPYTINEGGGGAEPRRYGYRRVGLVKLLGFRLKYRPYWWKRRTA